MWNLFSQCQCCHNDNSTNFSNQEFIPQTFHLETLQILQTEKNFECSMKGRHKKLMWISEMFSRDISPLKRGNSTPLLRNLQPFLMTITLVLNLNVWVSHILLCTWKMFKLYQKCKRNEYIYVFLNDRT